MLFEAISDFLIRLTEITAGLAPWQQAGFLVLIGAIPFVESYGGAVVGTMSGVSPVLAVAAPVVGNLVCTFAVIALAARTRTAIARRRGGAEGALELSKRQQKVQKYLERYGVPGVCILGPLVVASQITAPTLVGLGARPAKVYFFAGVSIVAWGVLFGVLGSTLYANLTA